MDEHTLRLARGVRSRWDSSAISPQRACATSCVALLEEGEVEHSILRLAELGADRAIHPHLAAGRRSRDAARAAPRELRDGSTKCDVPAWRLGLIALARQLPPDEVYDWFAAAEGASARRRADRGRCYRRAAASPSGCASRTSSLPRSSRSPSRYAPDAPLFALALAASRAARTSTSSGLPRHPPRGDRQRPRRARAGASRRAWGRSSTELLPPQAERRARRAASRSSRPREGAHQRGDPLGRARGLTRSSSRRVRRRQRRRRIASLNLGRKTGDDAGARRREPPARSAQEVGADAARLALNCQVHSRSSTALETAQRRRSQGRRALDR